MSYCTALLLPGERKSVEPMAARLAPDTVRRMHQSLHHVVADAAWNDEAVLNRCLDFELPAMLRQEPIVAWVVDDTGFPKKGHKSVGVARQYCGQVGKQDNCRVAVSLSITTEKASMPVAFRLRSEEHTSELQSQSNLVCRLLLEKKKNPRYSISSITVFVSSSEAEHYMRLCSL